MTESAKVIAGNELGDAESSVLPFAPSVLNREIQSHYRALSPSPCFPSPFPLAPPTP